MISCSEEYLPETGQSTMEGVVLAELEVGKRVRFNLVTTFSNESSPVPIHEDDIEGFLINSTTIEKEQIRLAGEGGSEWLSNAFKFQPGHDIAIELNSMTPAMESLYASSTVPFSGSILEKEFTATSDIDLFDFNLTLGEIELGNFYHLQAFTLKSDNSKSFLEISEISLGSDNIFELNHMDGILIDYSSLGSEKSFTFKGKLLDENIIQGNGPIKVYFKLKTVTEDYYQYHRSLSLQNLSVQGPFDPPMESYTNIERGHGIFTAYTSILDSLRVR